MRTNDQIRKYARSTYVDPARRRGDTRISIVAGDVHKALRLDNRVPQVCSALRSKKFLSENHLNLEKAEGPPSGMSNTMTFTYRLVESVPNEQVESLESLLELKGIGRNLFPEPGGWEEFIRKERERFYEPGEDL